MDDEKLDDDALHVRVEKFDLEKQDLFWKFEGFGVKKGRDVDVTVDMFMV